MIDLNLPQWFSQLAHREHRRRWLRCFYMMTGDAILCMVAMALCYLMRVGWQEAFYPEYKVAYSRVLPVLIALRLAWGMYYHIFMWSFRDASLPEVVLVYKSVFWSSVCFLGIALVCPPLIYQFPRSFFLMEPLVSLSLFLGVRFVPRILMAQEGVKQPKPDQVRALVVGCGNAAKRLLREMQKTPESLRRIMGFVDDDPMKLGSTVEGKTVLGTTANLSKIIDRWDIQEVIFAIPSAPAKRTREIIAQYIHRPLKMTIVPSYSQMFSNNNGLLQSVRPEDLLEREAIQFSSAELIRFFQQKVVLVTGGGGSIGSEIARQVAMNSPRKLILIDINENNLYLLKCELAQSFPQLEVEVHIASIQERATIQRIAGRNQVQIIYHAAAYKHVPLMEEDPAEAVKNNILGTQNMVEIAGQMRVEVFLLISTDKAVNSTNAMGATKRAAECLTQLAQKQYPQTCYLCVRFGNVLGSAGSLLPILKAQIAAGGPVTITDPQITRYFMTIPESVGLVLLASVRQEGKMCVLDMGEPVSIDHLARSLIVLAGHIPDVDIPIRYIGLRPGEKLHEELFYAQENKRLSSHHKIFIVVPHEVPACFLEKMQRLINAAYEETDSAQIKTLLAELIPSYTPQITTSASAKG